MSTRLGMDAAAVRQTAAAIDIQAGELDQVIGSVDALVADTAGHWFGHGAAEFHHHWIGRDRPALVALVTALRHCALTVRVNAEAQDRASSVNSGLSTGTPGSGSRPDDGGDVGWLGFAADAGGFLLTAMGNPLRDVGRYPKNWAQVISDSSRVWNKGLSHLPAGVQRQLSGVPDDVLRYKRWPILNELNKHGVIDVLEQNHKFLDTAGKASGAVNILGDGANAYLDARDHHYISAGLDGGDAAANAIKMKTGLVGYLGGAALQSWVEVGRAGQKVDWSAQGRNEILHASPGDWASGFGYGLKQMPDELFKIFG